LCHFCLKKDLDAEVNAILPALPLVLQHKMGASIWDWFNEEARTNTAGYWWCPRKGVRVVGDEETDSWGGSLESEDDAGYWSSTSGASGLSCASNATGGSVLEPFDITASAGKNEYGYEGDDQSVGAWSTVTTKRTDPGARVTHGDPASSIDTSTTSPMSTLSPAESATAQEALLQRMRDDPAYAQSLMQQFNAAKTQSPATAPEPPPNNVGEGLTK
jgi:hypothetical protein